MVRVGHRPNTCGLRPSQLSLLRSRPLGQVSKGLDLSVSRPSLQRSWPLGRSAKSPKVSTSRSLGQDSKGLGLSVRLTGHRAARWVPASPNTGTIIIIIKKYIYIYNKKKSIKMINKFNYI